MKDIIISQSEYPLFRFCNSSKKFSKFTKKKDPVFKEFRDAKICEWWALGYTHKEIAKGVGVSRARVTQIVLEKCTQVQKTNILSERAKKNNVHRNTQAKIEKIRKYAPWLAKQCEQKKISVSAAWKQINEMLDISKTKKTG